MRKLKDRIHCDAQVHKPNAEREIQVLREIIERILLLALHCTRRTKKAGEDVSHTERKGGGGDNKKDAPSAIPLRKCSWLSFVAPSRRAIMPASTQTALSCAPLNSSVLRASSS